jgi:hypothetical protein
MSQVVIPTIEDIKTWDEIKWANEGPYTPQAYLNRKYFFVAGVYALISDETILYVGQSTHLRFRVSGHAKKIQATKSGFKNIRSFVLATENRKELEKAMIKALKPLLNIQYKN